MKQLQVAIRDVYEITVDGKQYQIEYPLGVVSELETKLGRNMRAASDWFLISGTEMVDVLAFGFQTHQPKDARPLAERIVAGLSLEGLNTIADALATANFPEAVAAYKTALDEARKAGTKRPNV